MVQINHPVGHGVPQPLSTLKATDGLGWEKYYSCLWILKQLDSGPMGPIPCGSSTMGVDHGSAYRSMVQINHPVGHGVPQPLSTLNATDGLGGKNPLSALNHPIDLILLAGKHHLRIILATRSPSSHLSTEFGYYQSLNHIELVEGTQKHTIHYENMKFVTI